MESYTSVETPSQVSGGEGASPVPVSTSAGIETQPTAPTQSVEAQQQPVTGGEDVATTPEDEFPDETAFQQLPGEQRSSHWQNARARIKELNNQNRELNEKAAIAAQLEELGGLDSLRSDADFTRNLFSSVKKDEHGNELRDPQSGLPYITTQPFIEQLQEQSPDTFYTLVYEAFDQPIDQNQTVGDWLLQQKYGLNPKLLDTYKQIQSPNDLQRFAPQSVSQDELTWIPQELHDAYKTFSPQDRQRFQDTPVDQEQSVFAQLQERKELMDSRKFIEETKAEREQAKQAAQQQWEQGIQQSTQRVIAEKKQQTVNAQLERLKTQYQPFGPEDHEGNEMVYYSAMFEADKIFQNPAVQQKAESASNFYYQAEYYRATKNAALASRAQAEADRLTMDLQREYSKAVAAHIDKWNQRLKGKIVAAQPQATMTTTPQNRPQPIPAPSVTGQPRPMPGQFGITEERKHQLAQMMRTAMNGQQ